MTLIDPNAAPTKTKALALPFALTVPAICGWLEGEAPSEERITRLVDAQPMEYRVTIRRLFDEARAAMDRGERPQDTLSQTAEEPVTAILAEVLGEVAKLKRRVGDLERILVTKYEALAVDLLAEHGVAVPDAELETAETPDEVDPFATGDEPEADEPPAAPFDAAAFDAALDAALNDD